MEETPVPEPSSSVCLETRHDARIARMADAESIRLHGWALVLGASSGFGEATSLALARAGLHIFGVHLDRKATLPNVERITGQIQALGREARFFNANAADAERRAEVAAEMQRVLAERGEPGTLRVLLHSLAFGTLKLYVAEPMKDAVSQAQMDMTLDVMAHSLVYWTQEVVGRGLMGRGGRIYAMTSSGGARVLPHYGPVSAAKGGPRAPPPPPRRGAGAAGDHRQRDPRGRDGHARAPEDPGPRRHQVPGAPPQPERAPDGDRRRGAGDRRARASRHVLDHRQRDRRGRRRRRRRVTYLQGVVLGLVQGLTEFLPVSSSGHLILVPYVFGWPDQGLAVDAALHLGTFAALLAYFRRELRALATGALSRRLALIVVVATVPGGLAGVLLGRLIEARLRSTLLLAGSTAAWALVMWAADRRAARAPAGPRDPLARLTWGQGLAVGCGQAGARPEQNTAV